MNNPIRFFMVIALLAVSTFALVYYHNAAKVLAASR